jgi:hypothetical protein
VMLTPVGKRSRPALSACWSTPRNWSGGPATRRSHCPGRSGSG